MRPVPSSENLVTRLCIYSLTKNPTPPENLVIGLATGRCPHTAIREDPSMNLSVIEEIESNHPDLDLIIIESGGDNITTTFSPILADYFIYIIDVAGGDKYPRKGGLGIENCNLLVINKKTKNVAELSLWICPLRL